MAVRRFAAFPSVYALANITIAIKVAQRHIFIWPRQILNVKIKIMHTSIANIFKMVTDGANITTDIKYEVACWFSISVFRFYFDLF